MQVFVLSKCEHKKISRTMMQIARQILGKRVTYKQHDTDRGVTLGNKDISRMWQLLPHGTEMILRRIKVYQN
jgi:hypothetical protein